MKKKRTIKPRGVLSDHKRVGKRFIPPFVAELGALNEVSWRTDIIPELLWLALLNDKHGLRDGAELGRQVAVAAKGAYNSEPLVWFAATSAYSLLDGTQQAAVLATLTA